MRNPGWAGAALIAVTLAVTACGAGSAGDAYGGGYGTPAGGSTTSGSTASGSQAMPASPSAGPATALKTETTRAGTVLASSHGLSLYYFTEDKPGSGKSVCTGGCATAWPPLAAPVKAPRGVRLPGPLGMINRPGGVKQVTLNGLPVYLYAGDKAPGQDAGDGMEGSWHVIKIHAAAATGQATALKVMRIRAGTVLASGRGLTLYYYSEDKRGSGKSVCTATCATAWPPLAAPVKAPRGVRLPGSLGVITRPNGVKQVTLNGYPLYFYVGDKSPGQATGNGIGGSWHVIKVKA
jgi:predicted lipoprotein with Yx(FWY)xxD motif